MKRGATKLRWAGGAQRPFCVLMSGQTLLLQSRVATTLEKIRLASCKEVIQNYPKIKVRPCLTILTQPSSMDVPELDRRLSFCLNKSRGLHTSYQMDVSSSASLLFKSFLAFVVRQYLYCSGRYVLYVLINYSYGVVYVRVYVKNLGAYK